ncbi:hypothetical protein [Mycolicibacterium fortuitum]|uniref:hypothetical protein n=1 Tax=Mycolicibacterium fortuitum TaxID=1766 RepID=UPI0011322D00|nr:hypothetical protein [Mycolicibacterium fortuitum]TPW89675.1 hypothetical protein FKW78_31845 [Mycolicibacterium fortuitum]
MDTLADTPATLSHGQLDVGSPPDIAWPLHRRRRAARLHVVAGIDHRSSGEMGARTLAALNDFADTIRDR